jgi:hypothetical protein
MALRSASILIAGLCLEAASATYAETPAWKEAPIIGLGASDGKLIGRVIAIPDASGGIWRVDTETGMVSRCWHQIDLSSVGQSAEAVGPWEKYQQEFEKAPVCSAWTEF